MDADGTGSSGGAAPRVWQRHQARFVAERSVWVLPANGAGDNMQLEELARALGWPFVVKPGPDSLARVIRERLGSPFSAELPADKRARYAPPWPDLVLFSGGRPVVDAWRIRAASGGHSRLVCIGRPWAPLEGLDLVVTTPQYRLPQRPNVLENPTPLNPMPAARREASARRLAPQLAHLPRPWLALLVGGDSGSYRFTAAMGDALCREVHEHVHRAGGSVLVSTSARTPATLTARLRAGLEVPHYLYEWRPDDPDNPLAAFLGLADRFLVTGDSASMIADACSTERPVAVFEPPGRVHTRLLVGRGPRAAGTGIPDRLARLRERLIVRGLWVPARDMGRYQRVLLERGLITTVDALHHEAGVSAWHDSLEVTCARIRALLER